MHDGGHPDGNTSHDGSSVGIPQIGAFDPAAFERAVNALLIASAQDSVHTGRTAQRVRVLWQ